MPYIKQEDQERLQYGASAQTAGELNFLITQELIDYLDSNGLSYQTINDIIGALEGAKQEFYRRVVIPYENRKIEENGDVYESKDV